MNKKKVYFLLPTLAGGGAERVIVTLLNNLDRTRFDVRLLLFSREGEYLDYVSSEDVVDLKINNGLIKGLGFLNLLKYLYKNKPDILFTSMFKVNTQCAALSFFFPKGTKLIVRETGVMSERRIGLFYKFLTRLTFNYSQCVIAQSDDMMIDLVQNYNVSPDKIRKIHNPIDFELITKKLENNDTISLPSNKINLVTIGRLTYQKGYDYLIEAFSKIENIDKYHLTIIGSGELKDSLVKLIQDNNVQKSISIIGFTNNPFKYLKEADIYVSSSRWEGFPNTVLEALACGTPVLANNYKGGINEILKNDNCGFICNFSDQFDFENHLNIMVEKSWDSMNIVEYARAKWDKACILDVYSKLLYS